MKVGFQMAACTLLQIDKIEQNAYEMHKETQCYQKYSEDVDGCCQKFLANMGRIRYLHVCYDKRVFQQRAKYE